MRKLLITTQTKSGNCANGSWDPDNPSKDQWSPQGGRHMITALSCLTLEIYYRYLPLYKCRRRGQRRGRPCGEGRRGQARRGQGRQGR